MCSEVKKGGQVYKTGESRYVVWFEGRHLQKETEVGVSELEMTRFMLGGMRMDKE